MTEVASPPEMALQPTVQGDLCVVCGSKLGPEAGPQLLPCLHSICSHCFTSPKQTPECPVCQETYDLKEVIGNLLLTKSTMNPGESIRCSGCHEASASGWCVDCQEDLCAVCVAAHQRVKVAREHYIHTITAESPRPVMCPVHKKETITSFCLTCEQLTCRSCRPLHPNHLLQVSQEAVGRQRKQIRRMVQKVRQKKFGVQKNLSDLKGRLSDLQELEERVQMEVKQIVVKLYNVLLKKAAKIIKKVENQCRKERELIADRWTLLQRLDQKHDHVLTFTDQVLGSWDHIVLLSCKKQIHRRLQGLLERPTRPLATMMELRFQSNEAGVKKVLKGFGRVVTREVPFSCSSTENNNISVTDQTPLKDNNQNLVAAFPPIRARLSLGSSQDDTQAGARRRQAWSYHPYQPKQPSVKPSTLEPEPQEIPSVVPVGFRLQIPDDPSVSAARPPNVHPSFSAPPSGCDGDQREMETSTLVPPSSHAAPDHSTSQHVTSSSSPAVWNLSDLLSGRHVSPISASVAPFRVVSTNPSSDSAAPCLLGAEKSPAGPSDDPTEDPSVSSDQCNVQAADIAQNSTQTEPRIKEELVAPDVASPSNYCFPLEQEEDKGEEDPVIQFKDEQGNLVVLGSLGRDWLPDVSVRRLSLPAPPSSGPHTYRVLQRDRGEDFQISVVQEDVQVNKEASHEEVLFASCTSYQSCPLPAKKPYCAACRISGKLFHCSVCPRAFHRECHFPPVSITSSCSSSPWRCTLCRDLAHAERLDVDPQAYGPPGLGSSDQKKCEFLLLSLICHKHSSALYRSFKLSSPASRYIDLILIRGRLLRKLDPPYRTSAEFISDVWLLLNTLLNSPKEAQRVKWLQRFFSKELSRVFGQNLPPSLLTDPYGVERVGER